MAFVTKECKCIRNAPLAQLDRAFGYGPKGRGFESLKARHVGANRTLLRLVFWLRQKISHPPAPLFLLFIKVTLGSPVRL